MNGHPYIFPRIINPELNIHLTSTFFDARRTSKNGMNIHS